MFSFFTAIIVQLWQVAPVVNSNPSPIATIVEARLGAQHEDAGWAEPVTRAIGELVAAEPAANLHAANCRAKACRVTCGHPTAAAASAFNQALSDLNGVKASSTTTERVGDIFVSDAWLLFDLEGLVKPKGNRQ